MPPVELAASGLPGTVRDPLYPGNDGQFMGESDLHNIATRRLVECLEALYAGCLDVFVAMNIVFYYERGNPAGRRDPDVLVARGVRGNHPRISYRLWEEAVVPCTLFEIASEETWQNDLGEKREVYAKIRVPEYFVFDADGARMDPALRGFRLSNGQSVEIAPAADGSLISEQLGIRLLPDGHVLRLFDLRTGQPILSHAERAEQMAAELEKLRGQLCGQGSNGGNS